MELMVWGVVDTYWNLWCGVWWALVGTYVVGTQLGLVRVLFTHGGGDVVGGVDTWWDLCGGVLWTRGNSYVV